MRTYSHATHGWKWEQQAARLRRAERRRFGELFWKYCWGLIFVCVMTVLSECAPHIGLSKFVDEATPVISHSFTHVVK